MYCGICINYTFVKSPCNFAGGAPRKIAWRLDFAGRNREFCREKSKIAGKSPCNLVFLPANFGKPCIYISYLKNRHFCIFEKKISHLLSKRNVPTYFFVLMHILRIFLIFFFIRPQFSYF